MKHFINEQEVLPSGKVVHFDEMGFASCKGYEVINNHINMSETKTNGQLIADFAYKEVGTVESPANSNMTKYGAWFGFNGVAWCAMFVSYCYSKSGFPLPKIGYKNGYAGCQTAVKHFKETDEMISFEDARPGDIIFFDWNGDGRYDHTGIFNGWYDKKQGLMYTIEGNTSLNNNSNGGQVMSRTRNKKNVLFVHPKVLD